LKNAKGSGTEKGPSSNRNEIDSPVSKQPQRMQFGKWDWLPRRAINAIRRASLRRSALPPGCEKNSAEE
jgi:hypothetical protein